MRASIHFVWSILISLAVCTVVSVPSMGASISIKTVKTEQERRSDGLGEESSGPYRTVDERIVSEEDQTLTLGSGADIVTLLVTRGSTVLLGNRSTIGTVELDDATSFIAPANANIGSITGDVGTLSLGASSSVSLLSASVSGISTIDTKASVTTAFLRTDTLRISPKASIGSGTLHVYEHFEGFIDPKFTGKIVIYGSDRTDISIAGRLCLLGPIRAQWSRYPFDGFLGNVDPLLDATMEDNTAAFEEIRTITENFEAQMRGGIARLLDVEHSIAQKEVSLVSLDDESRREARKEMDNLISMKALIEAKLESVFIETFDQLDPVIDPDSRAQRIWTQVRKMYENAFNARDFSLVYALCGNAQSPEVSDTATPTNPNSDTRSESILSAEERASVIRRISHLSDERLVEIQSRLAVAKSKIVSKPKISEKDHRTLAILTEIERMVRDEMLYSDK